jgi:cytochrome c5
MLKSTPALAVMALLGIAIPSIAAFAHQPAQGSQNNAARSTPAKSQQASEEGLQILNSSCTSCHEASVITQPRPKADWQPIIERMRANGANISDPDAKTLLAYLIKNYSNGH